MFDKKNVEDIRLLNNAQSSILIAVLKEQDSGAYMHHLCFDIAGELDVDCMKKAYESLVAKYSVLRSIILYKNVQKPVQVILKKREDELEFIKVSKECLEQETEKMVQATKEKQGKVEGTYLYDMSLLQCDQTHSRLMLAFHHIILDGWSLGLVVIDFFKMYKKAKNGENPFEKEEFVLKDFLRWEKKNQMEEVSDTLHDMVDLAVKPTGIEPQEKKTGAFHEKTCVHLLNSESYSKIEVFCKKNNITSNSFYLGIWAILLAHYNRADEVSFGTVLSGRNAKVAAIEDAVGLFIQTVPLILEIDWKSSALELMKKINEISLLYMKEPQSVEYCQKKGMQAYNHIVAFENYPIADLLTSENDAFGVEISNIQYFGYTSFDFGFSLTPIRDETIEICIKYNAFTYTEAYMEQVIKGYETIIEEVLNKQQPLGAIHIVDKETQKAAFVSDLNWEIKETIIDRFEKIVAANEEQVAVMDDCRSITYNELDMQSNQVANHLRTLSIGPGEIVAVYAKRNVEMIIGMLAILKTGAAYLPINFDFAKGRMSQYLQEADVKVILAQDQECAQRLESNYTVVNLEEVLNKENSDVTKPDVLINEEMLAYVIYTSGSTGKPKGIGITHKNLINLINGLSQEVYANYAEKLNVGVITSFMFDASVKQIYGALLTGNTLCIASEEERSSGMQLLAFYKRAHIDIADGTPTHLHLILQELKETETLDVKEILIGGEQLTMDIADAVFKHVKAGQKIVLSNVYGPTECCVDTTIYRITDTKEIREIAIPIGIALKNYQTVIVDRNGSVVPKGVMGELWIGGPSVSGGYIRNEVETKKHFVENPFEPGRHLYKTGDLVKELPDGNICFIGRADHQVKLNGYRMELDEIEQCIQASGMTRNAAVIVQETNQHAQILCAFIELKDSFDEKDVRSYLKEKLADYMVPTHFMKLDALPVNSNGKIDRKALAAMDRNVEIDELEYEAAENSTQENLCMIFEKVLQVEKVGINNDFYELGGTSLNAISLVSEIYKNFKVYLSPRVIFQYPLVKELAEQILLERDKVKFEPIERTDALSGKASKEQQRIYALTYEADGESYHIQQGFSFYQPVQTEKLQGILLALVKRHEALRTYFQVENGEVIARINPDAVLNCSVIELDVFDGDRAKQEFAKLRTVYQLEQGSLYRFLICQTKESTVLLFDAHHIIMDGESVNVLFGDLFELLQGKELAPLSYQMLDYAIWQDSYRNTQEYQKKEEFFKTYLEGSCECFIVPDKKARRDEVGTGLILEQINQKLKNELLGLANDNRVTLNMLLSSAFGILLAKYTNSSDIMFGMVSANRKNLNFSRSVGMFVNTLVMRMHPEKDKKFRDFLGEAKSLMIDLVENEEYQYDDLLRLQEVPANPIHILFVMEKEEVQEFNIPPYRVVPVPSDYSDAKFDVAFYCTTSKDGLNIRIEYNTKLYEKTTIQNLVNAYTTLLNEVVDRSDEVIGALKIIDKKQEKRILKEFNDTKRTYENESSLPCMFSKVAKKYSDCTALVYEGTSICYQELERRTDHLASRLLNLGVKEGEVIALFIEQKVEQIVAILAVLKAGGIYMPIDTGYPQKRIQFMLQDSQAKFVITENDYVGENYFEACQCIVESEDKNHPIRNLVKQNGDSYAYLMYTSGTTGRPKGVIVKHKNVMRLVNHSEFMELKEGGRFLQTSSVVFDASTLEIWGSLLNGMTLYLTKKDEVLNADRVAQYIRQDKIDALWLSAPLFNQLSREHEEMFKGVTWLLVGGDVLPAEQINKVRAYNPGIHIVNGYGPTENTTFSATFTIDGEYESIPIGYPVTNSTIYIMDESYHLLPIGAVGEICVGGDGVAAGYLHDQELTDEKFVNNSYGEGRLYCTGDLGRWSEKGYIEFLGRKDNQVKIRGFRVETKEIEQVVNQHELVQESLVDVREKEGIKYLVLFYVGQIAKLDLLEYVKKELPEYMRPANYVNLEKMPLNSNGKIDRAQIKLLQAEESLQTEFIEPEDEFETKVCEVWSEVLKLNQVSVTDNYYDLGGDSLMAIKVLSKLNSCMNVHITFRDILLYPTVKELASRIKEKEQTGTSETIEAVPCEAKTNLLSVQQMRICRASYMSESSNAYNICSKYKVLGTLDRVRLGQAVTCLLEAYPILKTVYYMEQDEWRQKPCECKVSLLYEIMSKKELDSFEKKFNAPMNLLDGTPISAFALIQVEDNTLLYIKVHHSIADGLSMQILLDKLIEAYETKHIKADGKPYSTYIEYQNRIRTQSYMEEKKAFWEGIYKDGCELLDLPTDYQRPQKLSYEGKDVTIVIPSKLRNRITEFSKEQQVTNYVLLLVAYQVLLYRYSGQKVLPIGVFHSGRMDSDYDNAIGMFVNTIPLRFSLEDTVEDALNQTKKYFVDAVENSNYFYEDILNDIEYTHYSNRNPLFDVTFSYFQESNVKDEEDSAFTLEKIPIATTTSKFDLSLDIRDDGENLELSIAYRTELYKESTILTMLKGYMHILECICSEKISEIADISLCTKEQKKEWKEYYQNQYIDYGDSLFLEMLRQWKDDKGIAFREENRDITYEELIREAEKMAGVLSRKGVKKGDIIAVISNASINMYIVYLGLMFLGAAFLPIDVRYPLKRIQYIITDTDLKLVIVQGKEFMQPIEARNCIELDDLYEEMLDSEPDPLKLPDKSDLAYVIYTSGSTGNPKGVMIEHGALKNLCCWHNRQYQVTQETIAMKYAGIGFDASVWEVFPYLSAGATICIPPEEIKLDLVKLNEYIFHNHITISFLPTQLCEEYINLENPTLKVILTGGDKLKKFKTGDYVVYNNYGPTENTVVTSSFLVDKAYNNIPIGKAIDNCRICILNKDLQLQPVGVPGELYIAGESLARGYIGCEDEERARFIEDIFFEGERMYKTGDWGKYLEDGNIVFLGRQDSQIKIRGNRIELAEIQSTIMEYENVKDSLLRVNVDKEDNQFLTAYIVPESGFEKTELLKLLNQKLPYYMVPAYIIEVEEFPLNENGKVDYRKLPVPQEENKANIERAEMSDLESIIMTAYDLVLHMDVINLTDDFFQLGGDSIKGMKLLYELQNAISRQLTIADIFQYPRIDLLAQRCEELRGDYDDAFSRYQKKEDVEPVSVQEKSMLVMASITQNSITYNEPLAYKLSSGIDVEHLCEAIDKLIQRHIMLQSVYEIQNNEIVRRQIQVKLPAVVRLEPIEEAKLDESLQMLIKPFEPFKSLLYRIYLIEIKESGDLYLLWDCYHAIADGYSRVLMQQELTALYKGEPLCEKEYDYNVYAKWQREYCQSEEYKQNGQFWKEKLRSPLPEELWEEKKVGMEQVEGRSAIFELSKELTEGLRKLAFTKKTTLYVALLSVYYLTIFKETKKRDMIVGCGDAHREQAEVKKMVGMFVNMLPIRMKYKEEQTYKEFFEELKALYYEIQLNKEYNFYDMVSNFVNENGRNNFLETIFQLQNLDFEEYSIWQSYDLPNTVAKYKLAIFIMEEGETLKFSMNFNQAAFTYEDAEEIFDTYCHIAQQVIARDDLTLVDITEVGKQENDFDFLF